MLKENGKKKTPEGLIDQQGKSSQGKSRPVLSGSTSKKSVIRWEKKKHGDAR